MAKLYNISSADTNFVTDMKNALADYYGDAVVFYNATSGQETKEVIFKISTLSDKVFQVRIYQYSGTYPSRAVQAWVCDDENKTNQQKFCGVSGQSTSKATPTFNLILNDNFVFMQTTISNTTHTATFIIAKASNGKLLCVGGCGSSSISTGGGVDTAEMTLSKIEFINSVSMAVYKNRKAVLMPTWYAKNNELELNDDGTFAHIEGLYTLCGVTQAEPVIDLNYYISADAMTTESYGTPSDRSFYIPLET